MNESDDQFRIIYLNFHANFNYWTHIYDVTALVLMSIGLIGGILALITLIKSPQTRTPSFSYHKALVIANLIYCANFLTLQIVDNHFGKRRFQFSNPALAYYSGVLHRVITSSCGYTVLYMTLLIAIDRLIGLTFYWFYQRFNKPKVAKSLIGTCVILGMILNSWSPWFEQHVICISAENESEKVYIWTQPERNYSLFDKMELIKNIYNGALRISYPIALSILTAFVSMKFWKQQRKRSALLGSKNSSRSSMKTTKQSSSTSLLGRSPSGRSRSRSHEKCLFFLMIAVVILAFIQVIPREANRIIQLIYPMDRMTEKIIDVSLSLEYRLRLFKIALSNEVMKIIMNLCTAIDRSLIFYLYFALNLHFRSECIRIVWPSGVVDKARRLLSATKKVREPENKNRKPTKERRRAGFYRSFLSDEPHSVIGKGESMQMTKANGEGQKSDRFTNNDFCVEICDSEL